MLVSPSVVEKDVAVVVPCIQVVVQEVVLVQTFLL